MRGQKYPIRDLELAANIVWVTQRRSWRQFVEMADLDSNAVQYRLIYSIRTYPQRLSVSEELILGRIGRNIMNNLVDGLNRGDPGADGGPGGAATAVAVGDPVNSAYATGGSGGGRGGNGVRDAVLQGRGPRCRR